LSYEFNLAVTNEPECGRTKRRCMDRTANGTFSGTGQHCVAPYNRPMLPAKSLGEQARSVNRPVAPPAIELPGGLRELGRSPSPPKSARNPYLAFSLPL